MKMLPLAHAVIALLAILAAAANPSFAIAATPSATSSAAQPKAAPPDISGLWMPVGSSVDPLVNSTGADNPDTNVGPPFGTTPELKGVYLESAKKRTEALAKVGSEFKTSCKVLGMPTNMVGPYAVEIMQTPTQINWAQEFLRETRRIYLDGRAHPNPEEAPPTFEGHSVARWEGNVLVVETTNIRQETTLGEYGHADDSLGHGPRMIIKERIFINDQGLLQVDGRVEDQDALVKPWQWAPLIFRRAPKGGEFMEFVCEDSNNESIDPVTGAEITTIPERRSLNQADNNNQGDTK
ncbi:hypothetical protein [Pseudomonas sp. H1_F01]